MKKSSPFTLQKVKQYSKAKYASESPKSLIRHALWLAWSFPNKMIKGAVTALLIVGLAAGLQACEDGIIYTDGDKDVIYTDGDGVDFGDGDVDNDTVVNTDGDLDVVDFDQDDDEEYDSLDGEYSSGDYADGDVDVENDSVVNIDGDKDYADGDGMMHDSVHAEDYCINEFLIALCDDNGNCVEQNCDIVCREENNDYMSRGCYNDKCQCDYYETDGIDRNCSHGEEYCLNNEIISQCDDGGYYDEKSCDAVCLENHGAGFSSAGCDDSAADKCQCEKLPADGNLEVEVETENDGDLDTDEQEETENDNDLDTTEQEKEISESDLD